MDYLRHQNSQQHKLLDSTAGCGKPHVRWCGRDNGRNPVISTRSSEHRIKYRLVYIVDGVRIVGYDNERGKGDHKHLLDSEMIYIFHDASTLIQDFMNDIKEIGK